MGGVGFTKDYPIEKYYRDCKIGESATNLLGSTNIVMCLFFNDCLGEIMTVAASWKNFWMLEGRSGVAACDWTRVRWSGEGGLIAVAVIGLCRNSPVCPSECHYTSTQPRKLHGAKCHFSFHHNHFDPAVLQVERSQTRLHNKPPLSPGSESCRFMYSAGEFDKMDLVYVLKDFIVMLWFCVFLQVPFMRARQISSYPL